MVCFRSLRVRVLLAKIGSVRSLPDDSQAAVALARDPAANYLVWVISRGVEWNSAVRAKGALHTHSSHAGVTLTDKHDPHFTLAEFSGIRYMTVPDVLQRRPLCPISPEEQKSLQQIAKGGFA